VADRIRDDRIDVLVDLSLHTAYNRLLVFARKPAPVQVTMLGMPSTTGLATMDYRLTDPYLDPVRSCDADYTERSIRLPHCYWCYQPMDGSPPVGELPARTKGFVTFGCLNQFAKVTRPTLELWLTLLRSLPTSRLVLHSQPGSHRDEVHRWFKGAGVDRDRLEFTSRVPRGSYLERYQELDLCLDPVPYNGGITTMDSLWMGVPVVTLAGRTAVGRAGVSILSNLGLPQLIAETPEQYVAIAVALAGDLAQLSALRAGLRQRLRSSPLQDGPRFAADVEAAFRGMWTTWCGG
jgi:predicted O-linked N-acetylglucosamine transferase (SPINDLY family)